MIDLHVHTKASDGEKRPEELIDLAISKNIKAIAITDHDTVDGLEAAVNYSKDKDILVIPGIELEVTTKIGQMHILGLFIDYNNKEFKQELLNIKQARENRNNKIIEELNKMGFEISLEELQEVSGGKTIGKPHFAKVFLNKNYIKTKEEMFDKYFNKPPLSELKKASYTAQEIIGMIKKANGIAILAHPQNLKLDDEDLVEKIKELKEYGLDGMECYHSEQTKEEMIKFEKIAKELNLVITKGTDYHGPMIKSKIELDTGIQNNLIVDNESVILEKLLKYIKKEQI